MNILRRLNEIRGSLMRMLTSGIRTSNVSTHMDTLDATEVKSILISRPNHRLGNLLMVTPLLQEVIETFPHARIDLFVKGTVAPVLLKNYDNINRIIQLPKRPLQNPIRYVAGWVTIWKTDYDIVINTVNNSASGRLSARVANAKYRFLGDIHEATQQQFPDAQHMAKFPVYSFRENLRRAGLTPHKTSVAPLDIKLAPDELAQGRKRLRELVGNDKRIICIFTFATGEKCYSSSWWMEFFEQLKNAFGDYNIIEMLPIENVSQIGFTAPSFYSTNVREIASLIAATDVFIGADSGMMHLASASHTPTVGLFKKPNSQIYEPYNYNSTAINTVTTSTEACIEILNKILSSDHNR